ncbi:MAG: GMC family oxidoreductase [Nitrospirota bacterium]
MNGGNFDTDIVVIGSGFGGSVMTCRLAEKGYRVCLLERGREYGFGEFPRSMEEMRSALWDPGDGLFGLFEVLAHPDSDVLTVTTSGLGGGSLIYSSVLMPMDEDSFQGWPRGISRASLEPYYRRVLETMEAAPYPFADPYYRDTPKTRLLNEVAARLAKDGEATGNPAGSFPPLALWFKGAFPGEQSRNRHGVVQSRCNKCGECNVGCNIQAKSTLNLNYIARARNRAMLGEKGVPAEVRTEADVDDIVPLPGGGYRVAYKNPRERGIAAGREIRARAVVVSCGSIGTTRLLLRLKKKGSLPRLSDALGRGWCGNGDLEATVVETKEEVHPTRGPTITYAIQFRYSPYPDGFSHSIVIEDGGIPPLIAWYAVGKLPSPRTLVRLVRAVKGWAGRLLGGTPEVNVGDEAALMLDNDAYMRRMMVLLGMGRDRSDGLIELDDRGEAVVKWRIDGSRLHFERQEREAAKIAAALGGKLVLNPLTYMDKLIAVHPLGGCTMADSPDRGVVNAEGEVFGHPGLYVADGSILPTSVGPNPSLTIAALAERIADGFRIV